MVEQRKDLLHVLFYPQFPVCLVKHHTATIHSIFVSYLVKMASYLSHLSQFQLAGPHHIHKTESIQVYGFFNISKKWANNRLISINLRVKHAKNKALPMECGKEMNSIFWLTKMS